MTVFGMLRIRNEERWIERVLKAMLPVCERIFVLDDHSADRTAEISCNVDSRVTLIPSPFEGLDESRDKSYLLDRIMDCVPDVHLRGDEHSPYSVLALDGDEILEPDAARKIRLSLSMANDHDRPIHAFKLPILYCWDREDRIRVDGVYRHFARPSLFRLMNRAFRFQRTPWGGNFHCSSIPQELLHHAQTAPLCPARILHMGYVDAELRAKKYAWYNKMDPNNPAEDFYRHVNQNDPGGVPGDVKLKHAGPINIMDLKDIDWL